MELLVIALLINLLSTSMNSLNVIGTVAISLLRYHGFHHTGIYAMTLTLVSIQLTAIIPAVTTGVMEILFDRTTNCGFYDTVAGGDVLVYQHLF